MVSSEPWPHHFEFGLALWLTLTNRTRTKWHCVPLKQDLKRFASFTFAFLESSLLAFRRHVVRSTNLLERLCRRVQSPSDWQPQLSPQQSQNQVLAIWGNCLGCPAVSCLQMQPHPHHTKQKGHTAEPSQLRIVRDNEMIIVISCSVWGQLSQSNRNLSLWRFGVT